VKAVFDTRAASGYDDDVTRRYHFPDRYLAEARRALGDWIVYREPRREGGRQDYVAAARFARLEADLAKPSHHYAVVDGYLPFDVVVPLRGPQGFYETALAAVPDPTRIGAALQGRSVRVIADAEFAAIVRAGLRETLAPENAVRLELDRAHADPETEALLRAPVAEQARRIEQVLVNRKDTGRRLSTRRGGRLRQHLRGHPPAHRQRRWSRRGTGGAYLVGRRWRAGRGAERSCPIIDGALAVRPTLHIADRRLRAARVAQQSSRRVPPSAQPLSGAHPPAAGTRRLAASRLRAAAPGAVRREVIRA